MSDPAGFIADLPERVILDEVQRAPGIFSALKSAVDRRRLPVQTRAAVRRGTATTSRRSSSAMSVIWRA